jgi:prolyl oligopeptidase
MDEFEYLEELSDEKAKTFIVRENKEAVRRLGERAKELYPLLLKIYKETDVLNMFAYEDNNPVILLRGQRSQVLLGNSDIYSPPEGFVVSGIWKVYNSKEIGVSIEKNGSDKISTLLISPEGKIKELGEMVESPFYFRRELCYIKSFRYSPPPDGGDYPSDRVLCGDDIVYGNDMKAGEFITVKMFNDFITLIRQKGWRYSQFYAGESFDSLKKIDEGEVIQVIDFKQGSLIYQKNKAVYFGDKKIIETDYPVVGVSSLSDRLAVEVIKDYRTPPHLLRC